MAIVTVTAPASGKVAYGAITIHFDPGGSGGVPDFVARTLVTKSGFTCSQAGIETLDIRAALGQAQENFELRYFFGAWGAPFNQSATLAQLQAAAQALFDQKGEPA